MRRTLAIVFAAALVGGAAGAAVGIAVDGGRSSPSVPAEAPVAARPASVVRAGAALSPEAVYRRDSPAVVVIKDTVTQVVPPTFFTPGGKEQVGALGSGFVVDRRGDIVTNDHVVQGAHDIRVGFSGGGTYPATLVGADPTTDIAVVRVKTRASALHPLTFADSASILVGDRVYAIGNPFGLERTMTAGIVSATGRDIQAPNGHYHHERDPDGRADQPRQLGRSTARPLRPRGRHQRAARGRDGRRERRHRLRDPELDRANRGERADRPRHAEHPWLGVEIETIDSAVAHVVPPSTVSSSSA